MGKVIHIHICKCGGTSVKKSLKDVLWQPTVNFFANENEKQYVALHNLDHFTALGAKAHLGDKEYNESYKFAFVRNPWARLVSAYHYGGNDRKQPFKEWLPYKPKHEWIHDLNCLDWLTDNTGKNLVNYIGKVENFKKDFEELTFSLGFAHRALPHSNKSPHKHYTEYYDNQSRSYVERKYQKDIEYFNYKFGE